MKLSLSLFLPFFFSLSLSFPLSLSLSPSFPLSLARTHAQFTHSSAHTRTIHTLKCAQFTHSSAHSHTYFLRAKLRKHAHPYTRSDANRERSQSPDPSNLCISGSLGQWDSDDIHAMPAVHGTQLESAAAWYRNIVDKANEPHHAREQQLAARARSAQAQLR